MLRFSDDKEYNSFLNMLFRIILITFKEIDEDSDHEFATYCLDGYFHSITAMYEYMIYGILIVADEAFELDLTEEIEKYIERKNIIDEQTKYEYLSHSNPYFLIGVCLEDLDFIDELPNFLEYSIKSQNVSGILYWTNFYKEIIPPDILVECKKILDEHRHKETPAYAIDEFMDKMLAISANVISFNHMRRASEDAINTYYRDFLCATLNYCIRDQSLEGKSQTGKSDGEVDIIVLKDDCRVFIVEALILKSMERDYAKSHIDKIHNYNSTGIKNSFILVYSRATQFLNFVGNYIDYINEDNFEYKMNNIEEIPHEYGSEIKLIKSNYERNGQTNNLFHIILNTH